MDIFLIILAVLFLLAGLVGCILPILPGPPLAYVALILLHLTDRVQFTTSQLILWLLIVIAIQLIDYFIPMFGTKRLGGSKWGIWGCLLGTLTGVFFFPPWGIILGPFAGAIIGELLGGKKALHALKAGIGSFLGFMLGVIIKFIVCGWFVFIFVRALI